VPGIRTFNNTAPIDILGSQSSDITLSDPTIADCEITDVRVTFRVTAADLAQTTGTAGLRSRLFKLGDASAELFDVAARSGTQIGTSCTDVEFADGGGDFAAAAPPYTGSFAPSESFATQFAGQQPEGLWQLAFFFTDGTNEITVECWSLELTLANP